MDFLKQVLTRFIKLLSIPVALVALVAPIKWLADNTSGENIGLIIILLIIYILLLAAVAIVTLERQLERIRTDYTKF
jgi:Na+/H+-dicarboxylate symporter